MTVLSDRVDALEATNANLVAVLSGLQGTLQAAVDAGQGPQGWSPEFAIVADGDRFVLQVDDWINGGSGTTKPDVGEYLGATGLVSDIGDAIDIRGPAGESFTVDATGLLSERGDYDGEVAGFSFLATDTGDLYFRQGASGWSDAVAFRGPEGGQGETGEKGDGWTGASYNGGTGVVTFTSDDGLGFATDDLRGADGNDGADGDGWTGASYDGGTGVVTFTSDDGLGFSTGDIRGGDGEDGGAGWSPVFAAVSDAARRVLQVVDWVGGEGTKPATGDYVGATGLEADIANGVNIRGETGATGPAGSGSGDMLAATYDPQSILGDAFNRANHTGTQGLSTISDAGTAAGLDVPASGDAASGEVVKGDDTRLSDARTPTAHSHAISDVTGLQSALDGKADDADVFSGDYDDLTNKPTLFSGAYADLTGKPTLGTAAAADTGDFATDEQGALADTAVQPARTISAGTGLTGGGSLAANRTLSVDKATAANIRAGASNKVLTADGIEDALALTTPSGSSNFAPDFNSFMVADWAVTNNRTLSNPTNVSPGDTRYVFIRASSGTRAITFGSNYKGDLPTLDDVTSSKWYLLSLVAYSSTHIVVASVVALS